MISVEIILLIVGLLSVFFIVGFGAYIGDKPFRKSRNKMLDLEEKVIEIRDKLNKDRKLEQISFNKKKFEYYTNKNKNNTFITPEKTTENYYDNISIHKKSLNNTNQQYFDNIRNGLIINKNKNKNKCVIS